MMDGAQSMGMLVQALLWYAVLLFSLCVHEAAHATAALWGGDRTGWRGGQVSLNPLPHIRREPMGTVWVPLISFFMTDWDWMFGWASTPYDLSWSERHPRRAALMALAGPLSNGLVAVLAFLLLRWGLSVGFFEPAPVIRIDQLVVGVHPAWQAVGRLLSVMLFLNMILAVFNLMPLPPMDGSQVAGLFMPLPVLRSYQALIRRPGLGWVGLVAAWFLFRPVFRPILDMVIQRLGGA